MSFSMLKFTILIFLFYLFSGCAQSAADKNILDTPIECVNGSANLLEGGVVRVRGDVLNAKHDAAALHFANCVAARYAINVSFPFVSNVASTIDYQPNLMSVESDCLILSDLTSGSKELDAEVFAINCAESGIPMI